MGRLLHLSPPLSGRFSADEGAPAELHKPGAASLPDKPVEKRARDLVRFAETLDIEDLGLRHGISHREP